MASLRAWFCRQAELEAAAQQRRDAAAAQRASLSQDASSTEAQGPVQLGAPLTGVLLICHHEAWQRLRGCVVGSDACLRSMSVEQSQAPVAQW